MDANSPNIMANSFISCAEHNPSGEVVLFGARRITWGELTPRIFRVANALLELGVNRGETVAFMFHNTPEFLEINFGIQAAGAVPVPMNYRFTPPEIEHQANHCDARVFLYDSPWAEAVEAAAPKLTRIKHLIRRGESGLDHALDYEQLLGAAKGSDPAVRTDWEDVAVMIYTGGTTGFPKGVMLTYDAHREMFSTLFSSVIVRALTLDVAPNRYGRIVEALPVSVGGWIVPALRIRTVRSLLKRPAVRTFLRRKVYETLSDPAIAKKGYKNSTKSMYPSLPFFHDAGYASLMMGILSGSTVFVLPDSVRFDPDLILRLVQDEQIKTMANVPTGWKRLVSVAEAGFYDLSSLRLVTTGGGLCPAPLKRQILELFPNAMLLDAFGQTEMTPITSFRLDVEADRIQDRSVGKSIVEVAVVDNSGREVPRGKVGEILYRSNTVMKGYYKDAEKTGEVLKDGWFRSGDLGFLDENGELRFLDRKKESINTGGEKVFPLEVEEVIARHPKVDNVCVIGVPDEEWGSTVRAVVVLKPGEPMEASEVIEFCRSELAGYKIPRSVVFVDELPVSPAGKLLRQQIRELYGKPS
jgi:acyl-CoA synthetase (AMP-forming)/AMP-acid ligase II